ncbi:hypothetical protein ACVWWI_004044 [Bradyrhizobium sp. USDA 3686]|uniref:hypothetical protein n=1 Tax=Bradyrhizobium canariense TaxID=255045 RepID=UPI00195D725B|nr:hypothetical protein [Bradyrhizobium canariense]MBM7482643.1 hypothetical protein [Bradyrhizobium canariense]
MSNENVAERELERKAVAGTETAFCKRIGIEVRRWNNFERGMPLSKSVGILLVQNIPGLTLDWLFQGKADGLPLQLRDELESTTSYNPDMPVTHVLGLANHDPCVRPRPPTSKERRFG